VQSEGLPKYARTFLTSFWRCCDIFPMLPNDWCLLVSGSCSFQKLFDLWIKAISEVLVTAWLARHSHWSAFRFSEPVLSTASSAYSFSPAPLLAIRDWQTLLGLIVTPAFALTRRYRRSMCYRLSRFRSWWSTGCPLTYYDGQMLCPSSLLWVIYR